MILEILGTIVVFWFTTGVLGTAIAIWVDRGTNGTTGSAALAIFVLGWFWPMILVTTIYDQVARLWRKNDTK